MSELFFDAGGVELPQDELLAMQEELREKSRETVFRKELTALLNRHNKDTETQTPDYILAEHLSNYLKIISAMNYKRDVHGDDKCHR